MSNIKYENENFYNNVSAYVHGAADMMKFMHDYYDGKEPIYPSEMEDIYVEFLEQFGTVKKVDKNVV